MVMAVRESRNSRDQLSQWLREKCQAEDLSMRQAAVKTGLSHATIADIIKGTLPSPETIKKLAQAFGENSGERLALEDYLLTLACYRTPRSKGELPNPLLSRLIDRLSQCSEPQLEIVIRFIDFLDKIDSARRGR